MNKLKDNSGSFSEFSTFKGFLFFLKKLNLTTLIVVAYEYLFFILISIGGFFTIMLQKSISEKFNISQILLKLKSFQPGMGADYFADTKSIILIMLLVLLLFLIYFVFVWSFTRGLIWLRLAKKKISGKSGESYKFFLKLVPASFVWGLISFVPAFLVAVQILKFLASPVITSSSKFVNYAYISVLFLLIVAVFILYNHFTNIFYYTYTNNQKFSSIFSSIAFSIKKMSFFLKPMLFLGLFFIVIMFVGSIISIFPSWLRTIASFGIFYFFNAVSRQYYVVLLERL